MCEFQVKPKYILLSNGITSQENYKITDVWQGQKERKMSREIEELYVGKALEEFGKFKYDFGVWSGVNKMKEDYTNLKDTVKQTLTAQARELEEVRKEYIPVKVEHLYLVNKRKKLFAGNCPICKSWVSEEFADMGDKEMRYCYSCGNELEFKGAE